MIITKEILFDANVRQIVSKIETDWYSKIMEDFNTYPDTYPDLLTWMELHPAIVGRAFMDHIINYGYTNEDIN